jgi:hypothetical protein
MHPIILFRKDLDTEGELSVAKQYFDVIESRCQIPPNSLVIPRYSALPFYKELEFDTTYQKSMLINSYREHSYIADFLYYWDIEELTPKTYFQLDAVPDTGPFVVKGVTNSRKFQWKELMFAPDRKKAIQIACELQKDSLLSQQQIIVRDFIPLKTLETGVTGVPFSNEWRFFCYRDTILSYGFYWSCSETSGTLAQEGIDLVKKVIDKVKENVNFYVVDIAETAAGGWIVIEMNDGSMSGLSENDPDVLYKSLKEQL